MNKRSIKIKTKLFQVWWCAHLQLFTARNYLRFWFDKIKEYFIENALLGIHAVISTSCIQLQTHIPHNRPRGSGYKPGNRSAGDAHLRIHCSERFSGHECTEGGGLYTKKMKSSLNKFAISSLIIRIQVKNYTINTDSTSDPSMVWLWPLHLCEQMCNPSKYHKSNQYSH